MGYSILAFEFYAMAWTEVNIKKPKIVEKSIKYQRMCVAKIINV